MFEVLTRKTPFDGEDPYDVARLVVDPHARVDKRPILPSNVAVNADLAELMQQCWTRDASQRLSFAQIEWRLHEITQGAGCLPEKLLSRNKHEKSLLDQMLPPKVSAALREGRPVEPEAYDCVTIFFSDIVGFTNISGALLPHQVMAMLDRLYKQFDALTKKYELFKVETIGDAYMVVSNLRQPQADHAVRVAEFALDAIDIANQTPVHADRPDSDMLHIRVGFHSGPVVASVVGNVNPRYCLFGDTVNIASRMESTSLADRIHMSAAAAQLLLSQAPQYAGRVVQRAREQTIKGKGAMRTYWLANQDGAQPDPEPPSPNQPRHSSFFDLVRIVQAKLPSMPSTSMEPAQRACSQEVVGEPYSPLPVLRRRLSLGDMQELGEGTPATSLDGWLSPVRSFTLRPQPQAPAEPTQEYPFEEQTGPPSAASAPHEPIVALARKLSGRSPLGLSSPFSHQRREIPAGSYRHTASDITLNMEDSGAAVAGATDGWMHGSYRPAARHGALSMLGSGAVITKPAHGRLEQVRALTPPSGGPSGTGSPSGSFTQRNSFDDNIRVGSVHDALHGRHVPSLLADLSPTSK
ncbi:hypothetical protein WJX72_012484 [[Myrmecia] bisecta]|uniref:Guanylate cyclase domain-containing protein n=1 Tax=[Myrmecia] bisecta TaxID=41462 RepID=A0AAW1P2Q3_9CHLO